MAVCSNINTEGTRWNTRNGAQIGNEQEKCSSHYAIVPDTYNNSCKSVNKDTVAVEGFTRYLWQMRRRIQ